MLLLLEMIFFTEINTASIIVVANDLDRFFSVTLRPVTPKAAS